MPFQMPVFLQLSSSAGQNPSHRGVGNFVLQKVTHLAYISLQLFSAFAEPGQPTAAVVISRVAKITLLIPHGALQLRLVAPAIRFDIARSLLVLSHEIGSHAECKMSLLCCQADHEMWGDQAPRRLLGGSAPLLQIADGSVCDDVSAARGRPKY
jgi:hypothetical protein